MKHFVKSIFLFILWNCTLVFANDLDLIFDTGSVAETVITVNKEDWDTLCQNYKGKEQVKAQIEFHKKICTSKNAENNSISVDFNLQNIGIRFRGNTSRKIPISKETGKPYQRHFAIDFTEFQNQNNQMLPENFKGFDLKCFKGDGNFCREILSYNFLRECGVWTAPRAGYTHLTLKIQDGNTSEIFDYGIYSMIEEVNTSFLIDRTKNNQFESSKGNLFKCFWPAKLNLEKGKLKGSVGVEENSYTLKNHKKEIQTATADLENFVTVLETNDYNSFQKLTDTDLLLRTLAAEIIVGNWDNYWINGNNFYIYFDKCKKNPGQKFYLIPFDLDNTLGSSWANNDPSNSSPECWFNNNLAKMLLSKPYNVKKLHKYLLEFSGPKSLCSRENAAEKILQYQKMIEPYINTQDIDFENESYTINYFEDIVHPGSRYQEIKLLSGDSKTNFFEAKRESILNFINSQDSKIINIKK